MRLALALLAPALVQPLPAIAQAFRCDIERTVAMRVSIAAQNRDERTRETLRLRIDPASRHVIETAADGTVSALPIQVLTASVVTWCRANNGCDGPYVSQGANGTRSVISRNPVALDFATGVFTSRQSVTGSSPGGASINVDTFEYGRCVPADRPSPAPTPTPTPTPRPR